MTSLKYVPILPQTVYSGLAENLNAKYTVLSEVLRENKPSGNSYMDLFAELIRKHGKKPAKSYARMLGADPRQFDGAIRCMSGMSSHDWMNEYVRLVACDLLESTKLRFKDIGRILGFSSSSFTQFIQAYEHMEPYRFRSLKQRNQNRGYHYP